MRRWTLSTAALVVVTATLLPASDPQDQKYSDKEFIVQAASGGQFEVKSSQLALQKSTHTDLKSFAQQMVNDHTKANQELANLLTRRGQTFPPMTQEHTEMFTRLSKLEGQDFDKAYGEMQVRMHEKAVEQFETATRESQDAELKAWADKTLPILREHLQMARRIFK